MQQDYDITERSALATVANEVLTHARTRSLTGATVVSCSGDLGVGKTAFVQELAALLGVAEQVVSPTYTIMKRYQTTDPQFHTLVHIDAYRLESVDEMRVLGFSDVLNEPGTMVCVEWPEQLGDLLPDTTLALTLTVSQDGTRRTLTMH